MFTMQIDDVFAMKVEGVVVVGVVGEGTIRPGDELEIIAKDKSLRVRVKGLETFDDDKKQMVSVMEASKGRRVGVWILGADKDRISKGDALASLSDSARQQVAKRGTGGFALAKGCKAGNLEGIHEGYSMAADNGYSIFTINVSAENIPTVFLRLIEQQKGAVYFVIEVGTPQDEETRLRKSNSDPLHNDVYYLDGLSPQKARDIFIKYQNVLVNDGGVHFGIGLHGKPPFHDEVFVGPYKVFYVYASQPEKYEAALEKLGFPRETMIKTVWDTFSKNTPGERNVLSEAGKTIWQMVDELKKEGLYLAERRED